MDHLCLCKKTSDPYMAILEFRHSPIDDTRLSPAQMFLGRRLNHLTDIYENRYFAGLRVIYVKP